LRKPDEETTAESHPSKNEGWGTRIKIDKLTPGQEEYLAGWSEGT
jgi:hypothetical protein